MQQNPYIDDDYDDGAGDDKGDELMMMMMTTTVGIKLMMTSWVENVFRIADPLWGENHRSPVGSSH